jgi:restriction system protein
MGGIWCERQELVSIIEELAGHKAGLALSTRELISHLPGHEKYLSGSPDETIRIRSEELDRMGRELLYSLGALSSRGRSIVPSIEFSAKYRDDPRKTEIVNALYDESFENVKRHLLANGMNAGPIDITAPTKAVRDRFGHEASLIILDWLDMVTEHVQGSVTSSFRRVEWRNVEELTTLFNSENASPVHGRYIDQRFVDYLERNTHALDGMHWRNFERLAAEYLKREGYEVELGEGGNDDGVDIRAWRANADVSKTPMMLVQCKRQKKKVGKAIVKALWTDVEFAGAEKGLLVTTSALEPGAAKVCIARRYNIEEANRKTVETWLKTLRTPGTGAG